MSTGETVPMDDPRRVGAIQAVMRQMAMAECWYKDCKSQAVGEITNDTVHSYTLDKLVGAKAKLDAWNEVSTWHDRGDGDLLDALFAVGVKNETILLYMVRSEEGCRHSQKMAQAARAAALAEIVRASNEVHDRLA